MLKMLSASIGFISNNVKGIQSFEKIINFFEYLKKTVASCGYFSIGDTPPYMMGKKWGTTSLKENIFSHGQNNSCGVAIGFIGNTSFEVSDKKQD